MSFRFGSDQISSHLFSFSASHTLPPLMSKSSITRHLYLFLSLPHCSFDSHKFSVLHFLPLLLPEEPLSQLRCSLSRSLWF
ncbi:hypothetical protein VNO77_33081 [Canavalia gladiata]|uniref:Uncharacterized protein n=1 Tax=Canavalia gladiata TaxID=3824 RepID=A0AAN9PW26_CANGL